MSAATQSRTRKGDWLLFDFALIVGILAIAHTSRRPGYWKSRVAAD
jgi:hypothetical protein